MKMLIEYLEGFSAGSVLGWITAVVLALFCIYSWAEKYRKVRNKYQDIEIQVKEDSKAIHTLQEQHEQLEQFVIDEVSRLDEKDNNINQKLNNINDAIDELNKYQKSKDINDLRDRINTKYRVYKARAKNNNGVVFVTRDEYEAFEGLIISYINAGGNSFVHTEIRPAMLNWEVLSEKEVNKLMEK